MYCSAPFTSASECCYCLSPLSLWELAGKFGAARVGAREIGGHELAREEALCGRAQGGWWQRESSWPRGEGERRGLSGQSRTLVAGKGFTVVGGLFVAGCL